MAAVEVAASSLYINAVSHLIILMTIRTTMLLLSAFSDVIMSRAKWIGFPLPTLSLYYNTYFQFFCQTHAALSHPRTALSHPRTALSHPRTALSHPRTALSHPRGRVGEGERGGEREREERRREGEGERMRNGRRERCITSITLPIRMTLACYWLMG